MSNAIEFISAYNEIDARLRAIYQGKGNLQFSDLVRRCAALDGTVRRYEEELISYARLRNAIVHNSTKERIIAEPCDEATREIVHIADLLTRPPRLKELKEREITGISGEELVRDALIRMAKNDFSNLPVYQKGKMLGILNNRRLVAEMGKALQCDEMEAFLRLPCASVLREEDMMRYYRVFGLQDTVRDVIDAFSENRKLLAVIITEKGGTESRIVNLLTPFDLPLLMRKLED